MRIAHVVDTIRPVGGAQTYARRLAELQALGAADVAVVCGDADGAPVDGCTELVGADERGQRSALRAFRPDVVHVHDGALSRTVEQELHGRGALVRSLHTFDFARAAVTRHFRNGAICTRPHGGGCLVSAVAKGCAHRVDPRPFLSAYRRVDMWLPVVRATPFTVLHSEYMRGIAVDNGVAPQRCAVVPYFVEAPAEAPAPSAERTVCFARRLVANKGLDLLLRALADVPESWDSLLVVGDGWDAGRCRALAQRLGLRRVEFRGWTNRDAVADALAESRVVVMPSRWPEPFGIVGLEAMASGRPVVASRAGGIPEWLDDGETGVLFEPGDRHGLARALERVLGDETLAARLGAEGRRRIELFSPERHLTALDRVYSGVAPAAEVAA